LKDEVITIFGAESSSWGIKLLFFFLPIAATETHFLSY